uniref:Glycosyltransferase 2-like domain-containing protein n=1 Tax=viral metagenome TaxID=1070528 RepID=A0A6C0JVY7_9ZZZZ
MTLRYPNKTLKKLKPAKFAMCIPCHTEDLSCIDKCFQSIKAQKQAPDLITMSVSSSTPEKEAIFKQKRAEYNLPIHYTFTTESLLPGANRNRAAAAAVKRGASHLSFFDFDDIMHPMRFKAIRTAFIKNPKMTGLVHGFKNGFKADPNINLPNDPVKGTVYFNKIRPTSENNQEGVHFNTVLVDPNFTKNNSNNGQLTNGHSTVKSSFWKRYPFQEDLRTGEDGSFVFNILTKGTLGFMTDPLTLYLR